MANTQLFNTRAAALPAADCRNHHGAPAYAYGDEHRLAQLAMTGCLNHTWYAEGEVQLAEVLALCGRVDEGFVARAAVHARERGLMKDMPALLTSALAARQSALLPVVFARVIDNGRMLRNFVQILRSGATGRRSLGTRPKKLVQGWLNRASERQLLQAAVGTAPALADIVRMVHPKPAEAWREAFFAWLIGKPFDAARLPPLTAALLAWRAGATAEPPAVPFQLLDLGALDAGQWARLAEGMSWQALRMNLNTLARHRAFALPGVAGRVAQRLADPAAVAQARAYPYQLLAAWRSADEAVPAVVKAALHDALDAALANVPAMAGKVVVCPDVSGSMASPLTGYRRGASSAVRCVDVAALVAAAMLRTQPAARVLPFEHEVVEVALDARDPVMRNADRLAAVGGGGTNCSAPLARLVKERAEVDLVVLVSDNQSWVDARGHGATETMRQWAQLKRLNPAAKLVCIDLQPHGSTQAQERDDILNVGGFGDAVFDVLAQFAAGSFGAGHWVESIAAVRL